MNLYTIDKKTKYLVYLSIFILFVCSLSWNLYKQQSSYIEILKSIAQTSLAKDKIFRMWAASHGGVYVPVNENTLPNPYLSYIQDRDIVVGDKNMTLMNPAYMLRQMMDNYAGMGESGFGIVS